MLLAVLLTVCPNGLTYPREAWATEPSANGGGGYQTGTGSDDSVER